MRSGTDTDTDVLRDGISVISWQDHDENENDEHDEEGNTAMSMDTESIDGDSELGGKVGRKHPFFQRSESTLCLGCPPPDPFHTPLVEAIPLADQPHLLQPNARREELFGVVKQTVAPQTSDVKPPTGMENALDKLPVHLSLSVRMPESPIGTAPVIPPEVTSASSLVPAVSTETTAPSSTASVIVRPASFQPVTLNPGLSIAPGTSGQPLAFESPSVSGASQYPIGPYDTPVGLLPPRYIQPNIISITVPPSTLAKADVHQPSVIVHSSTAVSSANLSALNMSSASTASVTSVTSASNFVLGTPLQMANVLRIDPGSSTAASMGTIIIRPPTVAWSVTPSVVTMVPGPLFSSTPSVGQVEGQRDISQSEAPISTISQSAVNVLVTRPVEASQQGTSSGNFSIFVSFLMFLKV